VDRTTARIQQQAHRPTQAVRLPAATNALDANLNETPDLPSHPYREARRDGFNEFDGFDGERTVVSASN
jgi:hypothetical protein